MNRGRFPQAGLASAVLTLYDKEKLTIQDARGVIRMDAVLLQRLSQITEEERELLQGRGVDPVSYTHLDVYKRQGLRRLFLGAQSDE